MTRSLSVHIATIQTTFYGVRWHSDFFGYAFGAFDEDDAFAQADRYCSRQPVGTEFVVTLRPFCECIGRPHQFTAGGRLRKCAKCNHEPLPPVAVWRGFEGRRAEVTTVERAIVRRGEAA
jgi:hypothetical protein